MMYYLMTAIPVAGRTPPACTDRMCHHRGAPADHVCLISEVLPGFGEFVCGVDLSSREAKRYATSSGFLTKGIRTVSIPADEIADRLRAVGTVSDLIGTPADTLSIAVDDWSDLERRVEARIWTSRPGVAFAEFVDEEHSDEGADRVRVTLCPDFDQARDYILAEEKTVSVADDTQIGWRLSLLAGSAPAWAVFPIAWGEWVRNEAVRASACEHIRRLIPASADDIEYAVRQAEKAKAARAWRNVSDEVSRAVGEGIGNLHERSWTDVYAMPIRIASRLGGWTPPLDRPVFEAPAESGRVLIADETGPVSPSDYAEPLRMYNRTR